MHISWNLPFYFLTHFCIAGQGSQQEPVSIQVSSTVIRLNKLRAKCQRLIKGYINNLTTHGVTKVISGSLPEKLFWAALLFGVFAYFFYSAYSLLSTFLSYDVIINNDILDLDEVKLPSITVCDFAVFTCAPSLYKNRSSFKTCVKADFRESTADKWTANFERSIMCLTENKTRKFYTHNCDYKASLNQPGCFTFNPNQNLSQKIKGRQRQWTEKMCLFLFIMLMKYRHG